MEYPIITNSFKRLLIISAILIFVASFTIVVFGQAIKKNNQEVKNLRIFLDSAVNLQTNFERSLQLYVEETQQITKFLLSIRPSKEEEYIQLISKIEKIGKELDLDLKLQYLEPPKDLSKQSPQATLDYQVSFFGNNTDLLEFLTALEKLPNYIKIQKISFSNPVEITEEHIKKDGNISIIINIFVK